MLGNGANRTIAIRLEVMYLPSNGVITNVVHYDFNLHFQGHEIWNVNISKTVKARQNAQYWLEVYIRHRIETITNFVLRHREPLVSRLQIWNVNIYETMSDVVKMRHMTFTEVDIRHRMTPLLKLHSVTLTLIFKVKYSLVRHLL